MSLSEYLMNNLLLVGVALASGAMLLWPFVMRILHGSQEVGVNEAVLLINQKDALVLDVREPAEYSAGHIPNARNLPAGQLKDRLQEIERWKARPVIVHCRNGQRSSAAAAALRQAGFSEAVKLRDGLGAWEQANLPIQKGTRG
ncbi:MAG: rhodanese-like domain-containing protein [Pseudomonadota bacterium]|jgi:rhodanese-related sulfurtransferase